MMMIMMMMMMMMTSQAGARRNMGTLSSLDTLMFHKACEFLSYDDARPVACTCKPLRDVIKLMRREWKLHPLTPRVRQSCRAPRFVMEP
jgi:hypothetical protein